MRKVVPGYTLWSWFHVSVHCQMATNKRSPLCTCMCNKHVIVTWEFHFIWNNRVELLYSPTNVSNATPQQHNDYAKIQINNLCHSPCRISPSSIALANRGRVSLSLSLSVIHPRFGQQPQIYTLWDYRGSSLLAVALVGYDVSMPETRHLLHSWYYCAVPWFCERPPQFSRGSKIEGVTHWECIPVHGNTASFPWIVEKLWKVHLALHVVHYAINCLWSLCCIIKNSCISVHGNFVVLRGAVASFPHRMQMVPSAR